MDIHFNPIPASAMVKENPQKAAQALGALLSQTPEYDAYLKARKAVNGDLTVQKLGAQMRAHQNSLQWALDNDGQHASELERLELEMEGLAVVQDFRLAENIVSQIFTEVDSVISQAAGVPFAANAKRSGCGCGG